MPSHDGFVQCYNSQAAVDVETMLIVATGVSQQTNDKQQVEPMLAELKNLPEALGLSEVLLANSGYFSANNVKVCHEQNINPLTAMGRDSHHVPLTERLAQDAPAPETDDPVEKYAVAKNPKTSNVSQNPEYIMALLVSNYYPAAADISVQFGDWHYALKPEKGYQWNREGFRLLCQVFQMTMTDLARKGAPIITIDK